MWILHLKQEVFPQNLNGRMTSVSFHQDASVSLSMKEPQPSKTPHKGNPSTHKQTLWVTLFPAARVKLGRPDFPCLLHGEVEYLSQHAQMTFFATPDATISRQFSRNNSCDHVFYTQPGFHIPVWMWQTPPFGYKHWEQCCHLCPDVVDAV